MTRKTTEIVRLYLNRLQPILVNSYTTKKEVPGADKETGHTEKQKREPVTSDPVKGYQVPEYYQHNAFTFVNYDVIMQKQRLPQPSNRQK